jgi:hypothetical protein
MMAEQGTDLSRAWPRLRWADWADTRDTLHMWTQIVGKIRMAHAPVINHWRHVTLYVSPRGLTTSTIPYRDHAFEIEFDFVDHQLHIRTSEDDRRSVALAPKPVAAFYAETMDALNGLGSDPDPRPPERGGFGDPVRSGLRARLVRLARCGALLASASSSQPGAHCVPVGARRQGQPGALLLGGHGPGVHPVLRQAGATAPGRRAQLPGVGHARGLLPRAGQLRVLAGWRR